MNIGRETNRKSVVANLFQPCSEQEFVKAKLSVQIYNLLKGREWTQTEAAKFLGTNQGQVSALMRCKPRNVSVGKLMEFLTVLGQDIEIKVKSGKENGHPQAGHISVTIQEIK